MPNRFTLRAAAPLLGLALVASACGDSDDADVDIDPVDAVTEEMTEDMTEEDVTEDMMDDDMTEDGMADDTMDEDMAEDGMDDDMMDEDMAEDGMADDMTGDEMAMMPTGSACATVPADGEGSFTGMADDPAATAASNNPELSTLVTAVEAAGLVDTLNGEGPFTIFAPVNSAFDALPEGALDAVLADTDLLTAVLTYHVVPGQQLGSDALADAGTVATVNGADLAVDGLTVGAGANVVCADIPTANATVHLIDAVLLPQEALDALAAG